MSNSRREFLTGAAALIGTAPVTTIRIPRLAGTAEGILSLFDSLPGNKAVKVFAPGVHGKPDFSVESNSSTMLFVASAIKTFVLCEALRQADSPEVVPTITQRQLPLNESVWSPDSPIFNPPNLTGSASERTALEAMIMHSDNTGTDMAFKLVGADNVRKFITSAGLNNTLIPDSTRVFTGYLLGAKNYKTFSWDDVEKAIENDAPLVNSPLNKVETLASSADDLVSYYSRALQGSFFKSRETLTEFRRILTLADAISLVPFPLGTSAFVKGGSIDTPGFHCVSVPGGMFVSDRWVYFAFTINWYASAVNDPQTFADFVAAVAKALKEIKDLLVS